MNDSQDTIRGEWRLLLSQWSSTRAQWRDMVAVQFEKDFWRQWEHEVPGLLNALEDLDNVLDQALRATD